MAPGQTVTHGRIVEYTLDESDGVADELVGERRPAMIVRVWSPEPDGNGCVNLLVFLDGENDSPRPPPFDPEAGGAAVEHEGSVLLEAITGPLAWATSRTYDPAEEAPVPGTWRWPPRVG